MTHPSPSAGCAKKWSGKMGEPWTEQQRRYIDSVADYVRARGALLPEQADGVMFRRNDIARGLTSDELEECNAKIRAVGAAGYCATQAPESER
jgi:hypothetical protein